MEATQGSRATWTRVKGEGGACVALYAENRNEVLLLSKKDAQVRVGNGANIERELTDEETLEESLWNTTGSNSEGDRFSARLSHIERREWFTRRVVKPLFERQNTKKQAILTMGKLVEVRYSDFATDVRIPILFPHEDETASVTGLLMEDALALRSNRENEQGEDLQTISLEIKPKCGTMPSKEAIIHPSHSVKRHYSRYKLQQYYKVSQLEDQKIMNSSLHFLVFCGH